jgi:hypothetical protein
MARQRQGRDERERIQHVTGIERRAFDALVYCAQRQSRWRKPVLITTQRLVITKRSGSKYLSGLAHPDVNHLLAAAAHHGHGIALSFRHELCRRALALQCCRSSKMQRYSGGVVTINWHDQSSLKG